MTRLLPLFLCFLVGCAGAGRSIVAAGGTTLASVDVVVAPAYAQAAEGALESSETKEDYQEAMAPWNAVEEAMRAVKEALGALESVLDVAEAGQEGDVFGAVRAVVQAVVHLADGLQLVGLEVPREVLEFLRQVRAFLGEPVGDDR